MQSGFTNLHTSYRELGCFETATERVGNERWEQMAAREIAAELSHVFPFTNGNYLAARSDEPTTWLFKTREGGTGILQITGFTENPRGVKIRYKLVQSGDGNSISPPPNSASQLSEPPKLRFLAWQDEW